jgi:hypothetical protein
MALYDSYLVTADHANGPDADGGPGTLAGLERWHPEHSVLTRGSMDVGLTPQIAGPEEETYALTNISTEMLAKTIEDGMRSEPEDTEQAIMAIKEEFEEAAPIPERGEDLMRVMPEFRAALGEAVWEEHFASIEVATVDEDASEGSLTLVLIVLVVLLAVGGSYALGRLRGTLDALRDPSRRAGPE